jgi:hypothetical protein
MRLMNARLCLDCEELHDQQHCPVCGSESFAFLTRWVTPSDALTAESNNRPSPRPPDAIDRLDRREQVDAYRQILNPTPPSARRGRLVARGAMGLALFGLVRMIWRAAPEARAKAKSNASMPRLSKDA